jgi:hypothetical protein
MEPKLLTNYHRFTITTPYATRSIRARAIPYPYDEDTKALALALVTMALMAVATLSMLVAMRIL